MTPHLAAETGDFCLWKWYRLPFLFLYGCPSKQLCIACPLLADSLLGSVCVFIILKIIIIIVFMQVRVHTPIGVCISVYHLKNYTYYYCCCVQASVWGPLSGAGPVLLPCWSKISLIFLQFSPLEWHWVYYPHSRAEGDKMNYMDLLLCFCCCCGVGFLVFIFVLLLFVCLFWKFLVFFF